MIDPDLLRARPTTSRRLVRALLLATTFVTLLAPVLSADERSHPPRTATGPHVVIQSVQPEDAAASPLARYGLTDRDADAIVATVPGLVHAVPVRESTREIRVGERTLDVELIGTLPDYRPLHAQRVLRGRFFTDDDVSGTRNVVVLGSDVVDRLFPGRSPIGKYIWIDQKVFVVIGEVVTAAKGTRRGMPSTRQVFLPLSSMRRRLGDREVIRRTGAFEVRHVELSRIELRLDAGDDLAATATIIRRLLDRRHDGSDFAVTLPLESVERGQE